MFRSLPPGRLTRGVLTEGGRLLCRDNVTAHTQSQLRARRPVSQEIAEKFIRQLSNCEYLAETVFLSCLLSALGQRMAARKLEVRELARRALPDRLPRTTRRAQHEANTDFHDMY